MKFFLAPLLIATLFLAALPARGADAESPRSTTSFDNDWRFIKGDTKGAEKIEFRDTAWRLLNLPHDWSIEGPFSEKAPAGGSGAFLPAGTGWYRKHFSIPAEYAQRRVFIDFDGVMANSEVWINGFSLGKRPNGYVGFRYELTGRLAFGEGKTNVLAVRVDNSRQPASRWYAGSGIFRHTRLVVTDPVHFTEWGTFVSTPVVRVDQATVRVQTTVTNQAATARHVTVVASVFGPGGQIVQSAESKPQVVLAGRSLDFQQDITILKPRLWDPDHPNLYHLATQLRSGSVAVDNDVAMFGIRETSFDPLGGFSLNGRVMKIKGVCLHQDAGCFGTAVPLRAWERRLEQLKVLGCNAIRTSHTPFSPEFLDLCDRMGFLVMDEFFDCWTVGKRAYDYHLAFKDWSKIDLRDSVMRDRNHPSIVFYSIGNEIRDNAKSEQAKKTLITLRDICHLNDPTRPVTQALFRPAATKDYKNGLADLLDVIGQNYHETELLAAFQAKPTRKIIGTENGHDRKAWLVVRDNPPFAGQFLWTGIDYLGEAGKWPWIGDGCGLLDRTGMLKPQAFERRAWWSDVPMVHITRRVGAPPVSAKNDPDDNESNQHIQYLFSDWSPRHTGAHKEIVEIYSNCQEVELFLNGKSLGSKNRADDESPRVWQVTFETGVIKAIGKNDGQPVAGHELRTAGAPAAVTLAADVTPLTPDWDDVCYVRATVVDKDGVIVPDASQLVSFKVTGPGVIAAVDNGNAASHESFQASERRAYNGQCFAVLKATGTNGLITLTASASGLTSNSVTVETAGTRNKK